MRRFPRGRSSCAWRRAWAGAGAGAPVPGPGRCCRRVPAATVNTSTQPRRKKAFARGGTWCCLRSCAEGEPEAEGRRDGEWGGWSGAGAARCRLGASERTTEPTRNGGTTAALASHLERSHASPSEAERHEPPAVAVRSCWAGGGGRRWVRARRAARSGSRHRPGPNNKCARRNARSGSRHPPSARRMGWCVGGLRPASVG